ncbi:MAG: hypothetical protein WEE64_03570 [Dehalococcoidia bacterium]
MTDEATTPPPDERARSEKPEATINAQSALRLLLVLLAIWTFFSGLALTFFQDAAAATIGGGLGGGEGSAAQRLLGVQLLVLGPVYGMLAWEPQRFRPLLWAPYAAQGGMVAVTLFDIASRDRDFSDGVLPLIVATFFFVMLVYVTFASQRQEPEDEADVVAPPEGGEGPPESAPST